MGSAGWLGSQLTQYLESQEAVRISCLDVNPKQDLDRFIEDSELDTFSAVICLIGGRRNNSVQYVTDFNSVALLARGCAIVGTRMIHLGSASEVGKPVGGQKVKEDELAQPLSTYGHWKLKATDAVIRASSTNCVLRLFNVAGFPLKGGTAFHMLISPFLSKDYEITIRTPGVEFVRDYLDALTVCEVIFESCVSSISGVFNLCSGQGTRAKQIIDWAQEMRACHVTIKVTDEIDDSVVVGDNSKLSNALQRFITCNWGVLENDLTSELQYLTEFKAEGDYQSSTGKRVTVDWETKAQFFPGK